MAQLYVVRVDSLGGSVAPRLGDPITENAMVELVKFLGRAAEAAGKAVASRRPVLKLQWEWGEAHVMPLGEGEYLAFILTEQAASQTPQSGEAVRALS